MQEMNPYGGLWAGIASGVGSISTGIQGLAGGNELAADVAIAKAKADAEANALKYKYYAVAGVVVLLIVCYFIFRKKD